MCGVLGIISFESKNDESVTPFLLETLTYMQNRGQDSVGLAVGDTRRMSDPVRFWKDVGSASEWFRTHKRKAAELQERLVGNVGLGHVRYATASQRDQRNAQPHYFDTGGTCLFLVSNGDLPFCDEERDRLKNLGYPFASKCDAEVIVKLAGHLIFNQSLSEIEALEEVGSSLNGAFSLVAITPHTRRLAVMRDPMGFRPLFYVRTDEYFAVCSESALLDELGEVKEFPRGCLMLVDDHGKVERIQLSNHQPARPCLMELYYFSRPDSRFQGDAISYLRRQLGRELAKEWLANGHPLPDIVTPLPHSGNPAAEGYAHQLGVPFISGIIKDRFSERIFQQDERSRQLLLKNRFSVERSPDTLGKTLQVIDDSIVRGDQLKMINELLRQAGIKQVFYASTAPPYRHPCFYGMNTPDPSRLIARDRSIDEIRDIAGVDILHYLSLEGTYRVLGQNDFCTACFTGDYPTPVPDGRGEV